MNLRRKSTFRGEVLPEMRLWPNSTPAGPTRRELPELTPPPPCGGASQGGPRKSESAQRSPAALGELCRAISSVRAVALTRDECGCLGSLLRATAAWRSRPYVALRARDVRAGHWPRRARIRACIDATGSVCRGGNVNFEVWSRAGSRTIAQASDTHTHTHT